MLKIIVRTPHETVLEADARSLRLPTETGQVGWRPFVEGSVGAFEAGVVNLRTPDESVRFIGTAGGLSLCDGKTVTLLTPVAVVGDDLQEVISELDRVLSEPSSEMEARTMLSRLEGEIVNELRRERTEHIRGTEVR